jgi:ankyrin repeat protein
MNAKIADRASEMTKHIKNERVKERTRKFLEETINQLDAIDQADDGFGPCTKHFKNAKDVRATTLDEIERKQSKRLENLKDITFEEEDDAIPEPEIDKRGQYGYTKLMRCVVDNDIEGVKSLLLAGANRLICDNGGNTPYDKAMRLGYLEIAELLL